MSAVDRAVFDVRKRAILIRYRRKKRRRVLRLRFTCNLRLLGLLLGCGLLDGPAFAQLSPSTTWAVHSADYYRLQPDIVYGIQNNYETKLDVYQHRDANGPQPTVIFMHGGGWVGGSKEASTFSIIPWLEMGWNVVNVEYRLG